MKKLIMFTLLLFILYSYCFSEDFTLEELYRINQCLDKIMIESQSLPGDKKNNIILQIFEIKKIINDKDSSSIIRMFNELELNDIVKKLKAIMHYDDQRIFLKRICKTAVFSMVQIKNIINAIGFMNDKRDAVKIVLLAVIDPENIDMLYDIFWTPADKKLINDIVDGL